MEYQVNIQNSLQEAFLEYGASVAQDRALIDVRDGLKPGLRQGLYAQYTNKLTHKNKFQKAQKSVAAAISSSYVHGDMACYSAFIRAAKPWAYRYPLEEAQGSYGTQCSPDTESASRYVEMRASELSDYLFNTLGKKTVKEWYENYDGSEMIPAVFPSIGFWNIVNGSTGIAVTMRGSIPQFNLKEVNSALIKILNDPNIPFEQIYCAPDFCGGGTITNAVETMESLRHGKGKAIRLRAKIEYDAKNNCLIATELPYGVYTDTILEQLKKITDADDSYGIERVVDHTKQFADIRIYLSKGANPSVMTKKLYHDTSLENFFAVSMIMLDHGRFPKVFGWREACDAYLEHIRECKCNELNYDLNNLVARNHIIDGLLICIASIDEVVALIRHSSSAAEAKVKLIQNYHLDEEQAKAVLDLKLQRLANLEAIKINEERKNNAAEIDKINDILSNSEKLNALLIRMLEEVSSKFGDARRTKVTNIVGAEENEEEENPVMLLINGDEIKVTEKKFAGQLINTTNLSKIVGYSSDGKAYLAKVSDIKKKVSINKLFGHDIVAVYDFNEVAKAAAIVIVTKNGYIKKALPEELSTVARNGVKYTSLKEENDKVIAVLLNTEAVICFGKEEQSQKVDIHGKTALKKTAAGQKTIKDFEVVNVKGEKIV